MFTGIIEEIGKIKTVENGSEKYQISINAKTVFEDLKLGDSISINGICLTVSAMTQDSFTVDVMPETILKSNLKMLNVGSRVNLERAMVVNGRFGGHFVTGHIDCTAKIIEKKNVGNAIIFKFYIHSDSLPYVVPKGSIAIDGISLTIVDLLKESFSISIIPYTYHNTIIVNKNVGDIVNLEYDILAKHIHNILNHQINQTHQPNTNQYQKALISKSYLAEHGFL